MFFQQVRVGGKRQKLSAVYYTDSSSSTSSGNKLLDSNYMRDELEALYMGIPEARRRYKRSGSFRQRQSFDRRSSLQDSRFASSGRSRFDNYKSGDGKQRD